MGNCERHPFTLDYYFTDFFFMIRYLLLLFFHVMLYDGIKVDKSILK